VILCLVTAALRLSREKRASAIEELRQVQKKLEVFAFWKTSSRELMLNPALERSRVRQDKVLPRYIELAKRTVVVKSSSSSVSMSSFSVAACADFPQPSLPSGDGRLGLGSQQDARNTKFDPCFSLRAFVRDRLVLIATLPSWVLRGDSSFLAFLPTFVSLRQLWCYKRSERFRAFGTIRTCAMRWFCREVLLWIAGLGTACQSVRLHDLSFKKFTMYFSSSLVTTSFPFPLRCK
jgi:hypothetical protein